jgi:prophage regulatory protein
MKFLRLPEVLGIIGISRSKLYADIKAGAFPPPVSLGARAVGWINTEVDSWMMAQANARREPQRRNWGGA